MKRHWRKVRPLLGSLKQNLHVCLFPAQQISRAFRQMRRWTPQTSLIEVFVCQQNFLRRSSGVPSGRDKISNGGTWGKNEQEGKKKGDTRLKSESLTGKKPPDELIIVAVTAIKQPCGTTSRTGWELKTGEPWLFLTAERSLVQLLLTYNRYADLQHMSKTWPPSLMPPF